MEQNRFDILARSLVDEGTSRRSVLGRLAASGVAATLGISAFTALEHDDAEARKSCKKRCKKKNTSKKRRKCRKRCKKTTSPTPTPAAGFPITVNTTLLGAACPLGTECGTDTGLECVALVCVPIDLGDVCVTGEDCSTGQCNGGVCSQCDMLDVCGIAGSQQCCVADATCVANVCVLPSQ